ncbi:MAG: hypothetical protein OXU45_08175 [Candidatus Melainabacteria bacterium]|nr:hypothetical protein [Candidatus Melainabacteria bacterium]
MPLDPDKLRSFDPILGYNLDLVPSQTHLKPIPTVQFTREGLEALHSHTPEFISRLANPDDQKFVFAYMQGANAEEINHLAGTELGPKQIEHRIKKLVSGDQDFGEMKLSRSQYLLSRSIRANQAIRNDCLDRIYGGNKPQILASAPLEQRQLDQQLYESSLKFLQSGTTSKASIPLIFRIRGLDYQSIKGIVGISKATINGHYSILMQAIRTKNDDLIYQANFNNQASLDANDESVELRITQAFFAYDCHKIEAINDDISPQDFVEYLSNLKDSSKKLWAICFCKGYSNRAIAKIFGRDVDTIEEGIEQIFQNYSSASPRKPSKPLPQAIDTSNWGKLTTIEQNVVHAYFEGDTFKKIAQQFLSSNAETNAHQAFKRAMKKLGETDLDHIHDIRDQHFLDTREFGSAAFKSCLRKYLFTEEEVQAIPHPQTMNDDDFLRAVDDACFQQFRTVVKEGATYEKHFIACVVGIPPEKTIELYGESISSIKSIPSKYKRQLREKLSGLKIETPEPEPVPDTAERSKKTLAQIIGATLDTKERQEKERIEKEKLEEEGIAKRREKRIARKARRKKEIEAEKARRAADRARIKELTGIKTEDLSDELIDILSEANTRKLKIATDLIDIRQDTNAREAVDLYGHTEGAFESREEHIFALSIWHQLKGNVLSSHWDFKSTELDDDL